MPGYGRWPRRLGVDRKTARWYVEAAVAAGLARDGGTGQLTDELVGQVAQAGGHGQAWGCLEPAALRSRRGSSRT